MFPTIHDSPHGRSVLAQDGLLARLEIDALDLPIHAGAEGLVVVLAKTDIHDGGAVLDGLQEGAMLL